MTRSILIVSGKGGVGKTTSAVNLAAALHGFGKNVLLVDAALSTSDVGLHLGSPVAPINFHHVLAGKSKAREAIYRHSSGLKVLPGSISLDDMKKAKPENMKKALSQLRRYADFLIIDSAAGFGKEALHAMDAASELIVVTNSDLPSVTNALKAIKIAESMGKAVTGCIVTRKKSKRSEMSLRNIAEMLEVEVLGIVPEDEAVNDALDKKDVLLHAYPRSKAAKAYKKIAAKLVGHELSEVKEGFFEKLFKAVWIR